MHSQVILNLSSNGCDLNSYHRIKKFSWVILAVSFAGASLFYVYAEKKAQSYTASSMIGYNNAESGANPDGSEIDTSEIKSSYITGRALKSLGMDMNADTISGQISIEPVITDEEQALYLAKLEHGEDYEIKTDQYMVTGIGAA